MREEYGKILQELMKREGSPTTKDFASILGISVKTLYNIFNGSSELTLSQIIKASDVLNIDLVKKFTELENTANRFLEPTEEYRVKKNNFSLTINLSGSFDAVKNIPQLLSTIKDAASLEGFKLV